MQTVSKIYPNFGQESRYHYGWETIHTYNHGGHFEKIKKLKIFKKATHNDSEDESEIFYSNFLMYLGLPTAMLTEVDGEYQKGKLIIKL